MGSEMCIRDRKNIIYHLSNSLQPIWSDSIEKIVSKIYTIDYYKNNKKQIVFASQKKIYSYDRKGNPLIGFPFDNPSKSPIKHEGSIPPISPLAASTPNAVLAAAAVVAPVPPKLTGTVPAVTS